MKKGTGKGHAFIPTAPYDRSRTAAEYEDWKATREDERRRKKVESIRYWITTAIAVAALIKAFLPEICAGLTWLSKLLTQQ